MKTDCGSLRLALLAFLAAFFLNGAVFAEDGEDDQPPVAKEEAAPVKPQAAPAAVKSKAAAPAKKAPASVPTKPKAPEAKKPDAASGKAAAAELSKEKPEKAGAPETKNAEVQKAAEGAPEVTVPVEAPVAPPPPPMSRENVAPKKESGGFFQKLFGGGDKKPEAKAERLPQRPEPPRGHADRDFIHPTDFSGRPPMPLEPPKDLDPKRLEAAKKVAKHFEVKDKIESAIRAPLRSVQFRLRSENMDKFDKLQAVVEETVKAEAVKHEDAGRENKAAFLAENYTVDELKQMEAFFGSEAGQKTIKLWSLMAQRDMAFGQNVAAQQAKALRETAVKKAKKEGLKVPEALEKQ